MSGENRPEIPFSAIKATLKKAAGALRQANVPFMLGGGLAVWARGGPDTDHDLDLMLKPEDAERALDVLEIARVLREQINWDDVRERTADSPYARAFFALVEELGVVEPDSAGAASA